MSNPEGINQYTSGGSKHMDRALSAANHESIKDPKVRERVSSAHEKFKSAVEKGDHKAADKAIRSGMHEHNPDSVQDHLRTALEKHREDHPRSGAQLAEKHGAARAAQQPALREANKKVNAWAAQRLKR